MSDEDVRLDCSDGALRIYCSCGWCYPLGPKPTLESVLTVGLDHVHWVTCQSCGNLRKNPLPEMPRWEHDKTVIANGWLEGRCPECGHDLGVKR